jgi:hypothetical protein
MTTLAAFFGIVLCVALAADLRRGREKDQRERRRRAFDHAITRHREIGDPMPDDLASYGQTHVQSVPQLRDFGSKR